MSTDSNHTTQRGGSRCEGDADQGVSPSRWVLFKLAMSDLAWLFILLGVMPFALAWDALKAVCRFLCSMRVFLRGRV